MVSMLAHNLNRDVREVRLFEAGAVFTGSTAAVEERLSLSLGLTGHFAPTALHSAQDVPFFELKGAVEAILRLFDTPAPRFTRDHIPQAFDPARAASVRLGDHTVASLGQLAQAEAARRKLRQPVWLVEIALSTLLSFPLRHFTARELSRFQAVERDFSFTFPDTIAWDSIAFAIASLGIAELQSLRPVETFRDAKKYPGLVSILIRIVLQSNDRTLTEEDLTGWSAAIIHALESLGGVLRS
jgi:phenylalanyl-tRNA synthetase beta chain